MRLIYNKDTNQIIGIIAERVTSFIPPSYVGENSTFIDIDYSEKSLEQSKIAQLLEHEGDSLMGKTLILKNNTLSFKDERKKQYMKTVIIDLDNLKLHKDVDIYTKKAKAKGASVEIDDIDSMIVAKIKYKDRIVGSIRLEKRGCCTYVYQSGIVEERKFYPHYIGFYEIIKHLQGRKIRWIDMNGFVKKDKSLADFKKKWGEVKSIEVSWQ